MHPRLAQVDEETVQKILLAIRIALAERAQAEAKRCMSCGLCFECDNCVVYCPQTAVFKVKKSQATTGRYVDTDYGKLLIPIASIRSFVPGLKSHPQLAAEINKQIEDLGSEDFKAREQAHRDLAQRARSVAEALDLVVAQPPVVGSKRERT